MKVFWILIFAFAVAALGKGNSLPSRSLKETSSIPVSSLKRVQNRLYDSTDDYFGTSQYTSGTTSTRDGITDGEEPSLPAKLKKSFNIGKKLLRRGDNLLKTLKKVKKITPPDNNWAQTEMTSDETQHFEPESFIQRGSGAIQDADSESSSDWAFNEREYDASGSGDQQELERNSLPSRSLKETSSIPVSSLKRVQNRLYDSTDDYSGTGQYTSGTTSTRNEITDSEEPSLQAKLKKSFNIGKNLIRGGDNLPKKLKSTKKITPSDDNWVQTEMTSDETQHFEPESFIQSRSGASQDADLESSSDWAFDEREYDASGSGKQEELERNSPPSRSLKETSSIPVSSLKRVQNRLQDSTDDYSGTGQYTSGTTFTRDGITDSRGPSLQAKLKKPLNIGKNLVERGDNLLKSFKKIKKITPPDNNWAQTEMASGETQHFKPESLIRGESDANQDADSESSTDWAYDELEYDASGSGEQEEVERNSLTSRSLKETSSIPESSLKRVQNRLYESTDDYSGTGPYTSGTAFTHDEITDSEEPSLQARLKKSFNIGKDRLRRGDNLPKSLKKIKKITPSDDNWAQTEMTSHETQHFEPESFISGGSGKSQDADSEYSTEWAFNENEYDASSSGEQEEMERDSETGNSLPSGRLRETSSGPTPARDGITDSEEPSLQAELKKSFNIGKKNLRRGDNLPKSFKKIKKITPSDDNWAQTEMTTDETQHFERESLISGGSGESQDADSEYSTDWAFNENEYDASGSGEQEEMERDSETGYSLPSRSPKETSGIPVSSLKRVQNRLHDSTDDYSGTGSGTTSAHDGITDSEETFLQTKGKKSFYNGKDRLRRGDKLQKSSKKVKKISPSDDNWAQTEMTSGETQHFESKSFNQRESDAIQGMDSESSTDWASTYFEYHASGSGEHKEMKQPKIYDEWEFDTTDDSNSNSGPGSSPKPARPRHIQTKSGDKWVTDDPRDTQQDAEIHLGSDRKPPTKPGSDIRWIGLSLAHRKSYEERVSVGKGDNKKEEEKGVGFSIIITSVVAGVFLFLLTISLLVFTWPMRKYYEYKYTTMRNGDANTGQDGEEELTSIRVDSSHPSAAEYPAGYYYYFYPQEEPLPGPHQTSETNEYLVASTNDYVGTAVPQGAAVPHGTEVPQVTEVSQGIHDKVRTTKDVITDDRKRDFRNAERRRIIKRHTSERKNSLLDSLTTAKLLIYGHSKNKEFEKKASERRRVIKSCESELLPQSITFADEIQTACSVIVPKWNHRESLRKSKEKCQAMKNQFSGKRKPSLTEEIKFAREIIVDSERRKYEIPAEVIEEMIIAHNYPGGSRKYYSDVLHKLIEENIEVKKKIKTLREERSRAAQKKKYMLENEMLWGEHSF